jgi:hypothetical protein
MSTFQLVFRDTAYPVPMKSIWGFLDHHRELLDPASYSVQSSGRRDVFESLVRWLRNESNLSVTPSNVDFLSQLANEFSLDQLRSECAVFSGFGGRLAALEQVVASSPAFGRKTEERLRSHERQLECLQCQLWDVQKELVLVRRSYEGTKRECEKSTERLKRSVEDRLSKVEVSLQNLSAKSAPATELNKLRASFGELQAKVSSIESFAGGLRRDVDDVRRLPEGIVSPRKPAGKLGPPKLDSPRLEPPQAKAETAQSRLIQIIVRMPNGKHMTLEVDPTDPIEEVKRQLLARAEGSAGVRYLAYAGHPMYEGCLADNVDERANTIEWKMRIQSY